MVGGAVAQTPAFKGLLLLEPGLSSAVCLTAASNADGAIVTIQGCNGGDPQKWLFDGGAVKIFGDKCLDVPQGANVDGTALQIWTCDGGDNQKWSYDKWSNMMGWSNKNKCLDLASGSTAPGNRAQIWDCTGNNINQVWKTGYPVNQLPQTSQDGQSGTNNCGTGNSDNSNCQTAWINSASDFCFWAPPTVSPIGDSEAEVVAYCTKSGRGSRLIPDGTLKGVHFVQTPEFVQITGVGDFTKVNVPKGDAGGELDNRGADGKGNPVGGLLYGNSFGQGLQYHEWTSFISETEFCFRACVGPRATQLCNHIYDTMGCYWNMPANYDANVYEECQGDSGEPMGVYGTSTWFQGVNPTPGPHAAPASSNCQSLPTVSVSPLQQRGAVDPVEKRLPSSPFPAATPAPSS
ncbi:macrofage activating glycoprotein [Crepidotus variabilis]|uniref:Macrofage activating glycoprotein n=1 Tax=Crepidotus variabilis TaxID=179855 RepID=A0A9P6JVM4_9AGAR|nr:macrofage activating glycoprotein [Crepidotus variabilis]